MSKTSNGNIPVSLKQQMIQYLYGELGEVAQTQLEEQLFNNKEIFEQLQIVEEQLIENYVNDALPVGERSKFEKRYLNSERRRKKLKFAQDLMQTLTPSPRVTTERDSFWTALKAFWTAPSNRWILGIATTVILLAGIWVYRSFLQTQNRNIETRQTPVATIPDNVLPQPITASPANSPSSATDRASQTKTVTQKQSPESLTLLSVLSPGQLRATEQIVNKIEITANTKAVVLQLTLVDGQEFSTYRAEIETSAGTKLLTRANLRPNAAKGFIQLAIPAQTLRTDDYAVVLFGQNSDQEFTEVSDYNFQVIRK